MLHALLGSIRIILHSITELVVANACSSLVVKVLLLLRMHGVHVASELFRWAHTVRDVLLVGKVVIETSKAVSELVIDLILDAEIHVIEGIVIILGDVGVTIGFALSHVLLETRVNLGLELTYRSRTCCVGTSTILREEAQIGVDLLRLQEVKVVQITQ